eukprot:7825880-Lingulodinium_polyedra.AAC.1
MRSEVHTKWEFSDNHLKHLAKLENITEGDTFMLMPRMMKVGAQPAEVVPADAGQAEKPPQAAHGAAAAEENREVPGQDAQNPPEAPAAAAEGGEVPPEDSEARVEAPDDAAEE